MMLSIITVLIVEKKLRSTVIDNKSSIMDIETYVNNDGILYYKRGGKNWLRLTPKRFAQIVVASKQEGVDLTLELTSEVMRKMHDVTVEKMKRVDRS